MYEYILCSREREQKNEGSGKRDLDMGTNRASLDVQLLMMLIIWVTN